MKRDWEDRRKGMYSDVNDGFTKLQSINAAAIQPGNSNDIIVGAGKLELKHNGNGKCWTDMGTDW